MSPLKSSTEISEKAMKKSRIEEKIVHEKFKRVLFSFQLSSGNILV